MICTSDESVAKIANPIRISTSGCIGYAAQAHPGAHEGDHKHRRRPVACPDAST
jgi:hypothetical protein